MNQNIDLDGNPIYLVVVVSDRCDVTRVSTRDDTAVVFFSNMIDSLLQTSSKSDGILDSSGVVFVYEAIRNVGLKSKKIQTQEELLPISTIATPKDIYVVFKYRSSKKGLVKGQVYKVINQDDEYYWLEGFSGKFLRSRFGQV